MINHNGRFTIRNRDTGEHRTIEIRTINRPGHGLNGRRVISLLTGPDNVGDYQGFGFVNDDGISVWMKKRGTNGQRSAFEIIAIMFWDLVAKDGARFGERYEMMVEKRCIRCNRVLTTPESIETGIGPVCAGRVA